MLATSALAAARQAVDASAECFEQAGAYHTLYPFLFRQTLRHVGDDETMVDVRDHLHCQLQAGGRPSSPTPSSVNSSPPDLTDILARFDDAPIVTDDRNRACTHSAKAKPEGSDKVRNCRCRSREHDAETSHA